MNNRRDFLKTAAVSVVGIAAGIEARAESRIAAHQEKTLEADLTKGLPDIVREDYLARLDKAREWLLKTGIDALFVEGGNNLSYFTNTV